ncbi:hypothetical protein BKH41_05900 [Helicobacter sp. 12S02232-10]|uniref:hypothetical protein n=1 Tax=Helicobacter sp. 12S02232-10 TaxID=1476197 RepID=UPI000BA7BB46|nr:hypothetical protein [Helicobacter sp. 12S02232-10]PAF48245.1 hypothetical protein BKH41_05900 [Helicobacter sp. 12S02232-10]
MNRPNIYKVIFSSIFFLLFVFTVLALLVSQFSNTFSQLFLILTKNDRAYDNLVKFYYFCGILMALGYLIFSSWIKKDIFFQKLVAFGICIILIFILIFSLDGTKSLDSTISGLVVGEGLRNLSFFNLVRINFSYIIVSGFFYFFFLFFPLILFSLGFHFNTKNKIGKYLAFFCPSINVCLVVLFASGFQAYYDKSNLFLYIDFFMFYLGFVLFMRVFLSHKEFFGFYEYANILIFALGVLVCLFCSNTLSQAENYYNARMAFYMLAFLGWCGEWMYRSFKEES